MRQILLHPFNMTPEITCSIVFGVVASVLALMTILQAHLKGRIRGMNSGCMKHAEHEQAKSNILRIRVRHEFAPTLVRSDAPLPARPQLQPALFWAGRTDALTTPRPISFPWSLLRLRYGASRRSGIHCSGWARSLHGCQPSKNSIIWPARAVLYANTPW